MFNRFQHLTLIMYTAALCLVALVGCVVALDDGQWHPQVDGSILGSGDFRWGIDDGQWKPELDGSFLGRGDLTWLHRRKRDLHAVSPNALSTPLDEPINALAKNAHYIQYNTEATRNILGGGIPLDLPADTPAVAAEKRAHAIAYENQKLATTGIYSPLTTAVAAPIAARIAAPIHRFGYAASPYGYAKSYYNYGLGYPTIY